MMTYHPAAAMEDLYHHPPEFVPQGGICGHIHNDELVSELHGKLDEAWNFGGKHGRSLSRAILLQLLVELLDVDAAAPVDVGSRDLPSAVRKMLQEMASLPVSEVPSIQTELAKLGCSYEHLCRVFRNSYGISPLAYINTLRVERARTLLRETQMSVGQVARQVGFDNPAYFTRLFRRHAGTCPRDFARQTRR